LKERYWNDQKLWSWMGNQWKWENHKKRKRVYWLVNEWLYPEQIITRLT
jgi:hypothetical protein